jgi:hypothetical protein
MVTCPSRLAAGPSPCQFSFAVVAGERNQRTGTTGQPLVSDSFRGSAATARRKVFGALAVAQRSEGLSRRARVMDARRSHLRRKKLILFAFLSAERSGVRFGAARRGACGPLGPACERGWPCVVGRGTPPELMLYDGVIVGTAVKVIVRERRMVTRLGVSVASSCRWWVRSTALDGCAVGGSGSVLCPSGARLGSNGSDASGYGSFDRRYHGGSQRDRVEGSEPYRYRAGNARVYRQCCNEYKTDPRKGVVRLAQGGFRENIVHWSPLEVDMLRMFIGCRLWGRWSRGFRRGCCGVCVLLGGG